MSSVLPFIVRSPESENEAVDLRLRRTVRPGFWSVGGGKGGSGKSFLTTSLAIGLAAQRRTVLLVDGDLGGANLHTCLGMDLPEATLSDFWDHRADALADLAVDTPVPGLQLISGARDDLDAPQLKHMQKLRFLSQLRAMPHEHILLDLGAGSGGHTLDFFLAAEQHVVVTVPEPTAVENTYRFLRGALYRLLYFMTGSTRVRGIIQRHFNSRKPAPENPLDFLKDVAAVDAALAHEMLREIGAFRPRLVVNMARNEAETRLGESMEIVARRHLGFGLDYVGAVGWDLGVSDALRARTAYLTAHPGGRLAHDIARIGRQLAQGGQLSLDL